MKPRTKIKLESNIDTEKLKLAFEGATSAFSNLSISVNNFKQQQKLRRKQNFFFVLFWIIVFSVYLTRHPTSSVYLASIYLRLIF